MTFGRLSRSAAAAVVCATTVMTMACGKLADIPDPDIDPVELDAGPDVQPPPPLPHDAGWDAHHADAMPPPPPPPPPPPIEAGVDVEPCTLHTFWRDADGDGFGDDQATIVACATPPGYALKGGDCYDHNPSAYPGAPGGFATDRGDGSFDYDCDKLETPAHTDVDPGYCLCSDFGCSQSIGWQDAMPACGQIGKWNSGGNGAGCTPDIVERAQVCR
jgi:hypothetical protein